MESFFSNLISFTGTPDGWTFLLLLTWCFIGEIGVSVPYLLESFWLLVGFNIGAGILSPWYLVLLWLTAQGGRQAGSMGLYRIARYGMPAAEKLSRKLHLDRFFNKIKARSGAASRFNAASPFSVAFARMFAMRIPILLVMSAKKRPGTLALGVLLSSIIWDTLYIAIGAIFGSTIQISPVYMFLISLGCIGGIYLVTYEVSKLVNFFQEYLRRRIPRPVKPVPVFVPSIEE